jgi:hypothetical protein
LQLKIIVSPVRIRVALLLKTLQNGGKLECFGRVAETLLLQLGIRREHRAAHTTWKS